MKLPKTHKKTKHHIIKSSGNLEWFSPTKLKRSIQRTGLPPRECKHITKEVAKKIMPGASTREIYQKTLNLLKKESTIAATHYSLKKSLQELGPTGYEFEDFTAKYFEAIGFETYVGKILTGEFVRHEVDIVASKPNYQVYAECKFHNNSGHKNDIKIVLYVKARWDDLKNGPDGKYLREYYVVTNTAFTSDAIQYANGTGLKLLGVNAPSDESFLEKIKRHKIYPITSLIRLKKIYSQQLLNKKIILCSELLKQENYLLSIGMSPLEIKNVFSDINKLLSY